MSPTPDRAAHKAFLDRYYRASRGVYDLTRKYYLFGRDSAIDQLLREDWSRLVEIGPGTGRNLRKLHAKRPEARYGGLDASDAMLEVAQKNCPWGTFAQGFAEDADYAALVGGRPQRVLFSYCLTMVQENRKALDHAREQVGRDGKVVVVDFADLSKLPKPAASGLRGWLRTFHVDPLTEALFDGMDATITWGPGRYYLIAHVPGVG